MTSNVYTSNSPLIVQRHLAGFKLIKSTNDKLDSDFILSNFLKLPLKIAFINWDSSVQIMNESNANAWGYASANEVIGKSIKNAYDSEAAVFSINHDKYVMEKNKLIIEEENCLRIDTIQFQAITAKFPWYDNKDRIIGVVAFAITLGLDDASPVQNSMETFSRIINPKIPSRPYFNTLSTTFYLTKRENDIAHHTVRGKSAKQIAQLLGRSSRTIEQHLENIKIKLGVSTKSELIEKLFNYFN